MTTIELIERLAGEARPVVPDTLRSRLGAGLGVGALGALLFVVVAFGIQPGLVSVAYGAPLVMKAAYTAALGAVALAATLALARPGDSEDWRRLLIPAGLLAGLAAWQLASVPTDRSPALMLGASWDRCPWRILGLSLPVLTGVLAAMRREAPVHLRRAGAAAGLLAGATAAAVYALACPERSAAFVLVWYSLGIALATGLGALLGPRLLRW